MTAELVRRRVLVVAAAVLAAAAVWSAHHGLAAYGLAAQGRGHRLVAVYAVLWVVLVFQLGFSYLNRPFAVSRRARARLDAMNVAGLVPAYNEDPAALQACLASMIGQYRRPQSIVVVDDGTRDEQAVAGYDAVRAWFYAAAAAAGVRPVWVRQPNAGKRHAQVHALAWTPDADFYWTVDSDTISDRRALGELLKPMADLRVQSVAGIVTAANVRASLLTRFTDLWFVTGQLVDRGSLSVLGGSVWVNSGPIALYRAGVLRDNVVGYLTETFGGRRVPFSDDSLLTLYAMLRGRTVQQPSAIAFALMPDRYRHFWRMYLRWMKGSTIRSVWRMRYLSMGRPAWWLHVQRWAGTAVSSALFVGVVLGGLALSPSWEAAAWLAGVPVAIAYATCLRYLTIRRSDQSAVYQWGTWLLAPVAALFAATVLRAARWWGVVTCWRTGWGTRETVEVALDAPAPARPDGGRVVPAFTPADARTLVMPAVR